MNLYAKYRYIFLFFQIVNNCFCQLLHWCTETEPFRLKDTSCGSFDKICLSSDDQCTELRRACKHCPGNITVSMIENISKFLEEQTKRSKNATDNTLIIGNTTISQIFNLLQAHPEKKEPGFSTYLSIVILHVVIWIFLLFEIRFKIITKLVQTCRKRRGYNKILYSRKKEIQDANYKKMEEKIENLGTNYMKMEEKIENFGKLFSEIKEQLKGIEAHLHESIQYMAVNFMIDNHGFIQLDVNDNQNIIEIKHRICDKLPRACAKDYKKMKFTYNGKELDNNEYLLKRINPSDPNVNCYMDSTIKFEDYLILKLQSDVNLPSKLQIKKDETPKNVVKTLENLTQQNNLVLFELESKAGGLIKVTKTSFTDKDRLTVVQEKEEEFSIKHILSETIEPEIKKSSNTKKLSSLLAATNNNDFLLFRNKKALDLDKFIFEYQNDNISNLDCYVFRRFSGITQGKHLERNKLFELCYAKDKNGKNILLKKYKFSKTEKLEENKSILNELKTYEITKNNKRFVQLLGTYLDDEYLYISMEFMSNGNLRKYLKENPDVKKNQLSKWLRQILTGLQFLHDNNAIQRDLNPSNIFLDEHLDLKLSNSNFAKFDFYFSLSSMIVKGSGAANNDILDMAYLAPEILNGETYGKECDIYSFGAVLSKILTGEEPSDSFDTSKIPIDCTDYAIIIDSCMQHDSTKRETIQNLLQNEKIMI